MLKNNKTLFILFTILFLIFALSSGADNSWIEIIIGSTIFGTITSVLILLIYKFLILLLKSVRFLNN